MTNLGFGGLFLQTQDGDPVVGDEVELEWSLPDDDVPVRAHAVVVWKRPPSPDRPGGFGVRFVTVKPDFAPIAEGSRQSG